jgi:hypothetical protein
MAEDILSAVCIYWAYLAELLPRVRLHRFRAAYFDSGLGILKSGSCVWILERLHALKGCWHGF